MSKTLLVAVIRRFIKKCFFNKQEIIQKNCGIRAEILSKK